MANWMSIDFGTSSSAAVIIRGGEPELVTPLMADAAGSKLFPTVAYVDGRGRISVCHEANQMYIHDPVRFLREFKLDMKRQAIPLLGVTYEEVVAEILKTLKAAAERQLQEVIDQVVLTVPAIYNDLDVRQVIMREAAKSAGFRKVEFLREAQAAALYYDYISSAGQGERAESVSLVYDLGGGTFDPALIKHTPDGCRLIGNGNVGIPVGGKFFTEKITLDYLRRSGIKLNVRLDDPESLRQMLVIQSKCESIKRYLSYKEEGSFPVGSSGEEYRLTRKEFEAMISGMIDRTLETCDLLLRKNDVCWEQIARVLMIGGSCAIPLIREKIRSFLNARNASNGAIVWRTTENGRDIDPQFAVALGGAIFAKKKSAPRRPRLGYIEYGEQNKLCTFVFDREGEFVLGRWVAGTSVEIPIHFGPDEKRLISRAHLKFVILYDQPTNRYLYFVEDLGSTNGTFVNDRRVSGRVLLNNGDVVRAGHHLFTLNA